MAFKHQETAVGTPAHCNKEAHIARWEYPPFRTTRRFKCSGLVWSSYEFRSWSSSWNFNHRQLYKRNISQRKESGTITFSSGAHTSPQSGGGHTSSHKWKELGREICSKHPCRTTNCGHDTHTHVHSSQLVNHRPVPSWMSITRSQYYNAQFCTSDNTTHRNARILGIDLQLIKETLAITKTYGVRSWNSTASVYRQLRRRRELFKWNLGKHWHPNICSSSQVKQKPKKTRWSDMKRFTLQTHNTLKQTEESKLTSRSTALSTNRSSSACWNLSLDKMVLTTRTNKYGTKRIR